MAKKKLSEAKAKSKKKALDVEVVAAARDEAPTHSGRIFFICALCILIVVVGVAAGWASRKTDGHLAWIGGMAGILGITTFFGMLYCYPAKTADKTAIRPAIAAALVVVWMVLAGLFILDIDLIDTEEATNPPSNTEEAPTAVGIQVTTENLEITPPDPGKTTRDIFGDMTLFVGAVITFYFGAITFEKISGDRRDISILKMTPTEDESATAEAANKADEGGSPETPTPEPEPVQPPPPPPS